MMPDRPKPYQTESRRKRKYVSADLLENITFSIIIYEIPTEVGTQLES